MADDDEFDTSRAVVKTYVPAYQKEAWEDHADRLGMSQSEFVRTMVQAGRGDFEIEPVQTGSEGATPGVEGLEDRVLGSLQDHDGLSWERLVEELTADLEERLEDVLDELQRNDLVRYSGREDGYALVEGSR